MNILLQINYTTILHETIIWELTIDTIIFNSNSIDKLNTNNAYRTMTGSNPSIATTRLAERQQITGLDTSTIIRLDQGFPNFFMNVPLKQFQNSPYHFSIKYKDDYEKPSTTISLAQCIYDMFI